MAHGFSDDDLQEGWKLLMEVTRTRLSFVPSLPAMDPTLLTQLDDWENRWFPIASATLQRRFPSVHERVFLNLSQAEGAAVIVSVGTFIERYDQIALAADKGGMGAEGKEAKKLLDKRGLTAAVINEARDLLKRLGAVEPPKPAEEPPTEEQYAAAETVMWGWYLEWSAIARTAIKDRRLLRQLGFLQTTGKRRGGGEAEEGGDEEEGAGEGGEGAPGEAPAGGQAGTDK
jgi:hypothetical protein